MLLIDRIIKTIGDTDVTISSNTSWSDQVTICRNLTVNSGQSLALTYSGVSSIYCSGDLIINGIIAKPSAYGSVSNWDGATDGNVGTGGSGCTHTGSITDKVIIENGKLSSDPSNYLYYRNLLGWGHSGSGNGSSGNSGILVWVAGKIIFGTNGFIVSDGADGAPTEGGGGGGFVVVYARNGISIVDAGVHFQAKGGMGAEGQSMDEFGAYGNGGGGGGLVAVIHSGSAIPGTAYNIVGGDAGPDFPGAEPFNNGSGGGGSLGAGGNQAAAGSSGVFIEMIDLDRYL